MNWNQTTKKVLNVALMLTFMIGIGLAASAPAEAQWRNGQWRNGQGRNDGRGRWDENRTRQAGVIYGYLMGYRNGAFVLRNGYRVNMRDLDDYRDDSQGWISGMHFRDEYRSSFRRGFELGFRDAQSNRQRRYTRNDLERVLDDTIRNVYGQNSLDDDDWERRNRDRWNDRYGRNDRDWRDRDGRFDRNEISRIAQQNGYREGLEQGREDRARRRSFDVDNSSEYRNALIGYRSEFGDRSFYQQAFREAFRRGYNEGYRNR
jgi:hypothetical protein